MLAIIFVSLIGGFRVTALKLNQLYSSFRKNIYLFTFLNYLKVSKTWIVY